MTKKCPIILLLLLFVSMLHADEKEIILGGDAGWQNFSVSNNITFTNTGRYGKKAIQVATASQKLNNTIDLLLDFEQNIHFTDLADNYTITKSNLSATSNSIMGNYAALGKGSSGGIQLSGKEGTIFGTEGVMGSFTISFWLNPSLSENGETIFMWDSSRNIKNNPVYQSISAMFFSNKLEWSFINVFADFQTFKDITLKSTSLIIPNTWALHTISFDSKSGIIEYRIDGKIEDIQYATQSGRSSVNIYSPVLGNPAEIVLCSDFTGRIDDFYISKDFYQANFKQNVYNTDGGRFETNPLGPYPAGSSITEIQVLSEVPPQTDIQYYVRASDNYFQWTDTSPEWIPVIANEKITDVSGMWFQIAANLYTDGSGTKTPVLTEIIVQYTEEDPPRPPVKVFAEAGNGYVDLSWLASAGVSPDGYMIYYGDASGEYLGEIAVQGRSPVDVGQTLSYRISGLQNGKIYYFAIAAYTYNPSKTQGTLSQEVYARPLQGLSR